MSSVDIECGRTVKQKLLANRHFGTLRFPIVGQVGRTFYTDREGNFTNREFVVKRNPVPTESSATVFPTHEFTVFDGYRARFSVEAPTFGGAVRRAGKEVARREQA